MDEATWEFYLDLLEQRYERVDGARAEMKKLNAYPNREFLIFILLHGNRESLNHVVNGNKFPAYDIALRANEDRWKLTRKQRHAITNVYLFDVYGWTQEQLIQEDEDHG